jgi:hypothetical protein
MTAVLAFGRAVAIILVLPIFARGRKIGNNQAVKQSSNQA